MRLRIPVLPAIARWASIAPDQRAPGRDRDRVCGAGRLRNIAFPRPDSPDGGRCAECAAATRTVVRLTDRESGLSARTIARRPSLVSGLYAYLVARGDTPVQVIPMPRDLSTRRQGGSRRSRDRAAGARAAHCAEDLVGAGGRPAARRAAHATGGRRLAQEPAPAAASTSAVALLPGAGLRRTMATCRRRSWGSRHRRKDFSGDQVCLRDRLSAWRQGQVPGVGPIDRGCSSGSC
jgi:hypothetical protein